MCMLVVTCLVCLASLGIGWTVGTHELSRFIFVYIRHDQVNLGIVAQIRRSYPVSFVELGALTEERNHLGIHLPSN